MENQQTKKEKTIHIRLSFLELKLIKLNAKNSGLSMSDYLRKCGTNKIIHQRLTQDEIDIYKILVEFHNNFKFIANRFTYEDFSVKKYCIETAEQIRAHLKKLQ